ncbi:hypothetical protein [Vreelandella venusta]
MIQCGNRRQLIELLYSGHHGIDPMLQRRRQPTFRFGAIMKPWRTVTQIGRATATPKGGALLQRFFDLKAAMYQFEQA